MRKFLILSLARKAVAGAAALSVAFSGPLSSAAEAGFWADRRKAVETRGASSSDELVAGLPAGLLPSIQNPTAALPQDMVVTQGLSGDAAAKQAIAQLPSALTTLPAAYGEIRDVRLSTDKKAPLVLLVQDVHGILSAQENIARMLDHVSRRGAGPVVVGLEGAEGPLDIQLYRSLEDKPARDAAAEMLFNASSLTGAEYFGITSSQETPFLGLEDASLYRRNVGAYRAAVPLMDASTRAHGALAAALQKDKDRFFSAELKALDAQLGKFHRGEESLTELVSLLHAGAGAPHIALFQKASALEKTMDFKAVEAERARLVRAIADRLSKADLQGLVSMSVAYRGGQVNHGGYYRYLKTLLAANGLSLASYPAFEGYVRYVLLSDQIDAARLFNEIESAEDATAARLALSPDARSTFARSRNLRLLDKLFRHELTSSEWDHYRARRGEIAALSSDKDFAPMVAVFEDFYESAHGRNRVLAGNLMAFWRANASLKPSLAVLVAGGFHTPGLQDELRKAGASFVTVTPRIGEITGKPSDYLQIFNQRETPLEKMLLGEKLMIKDQLGTSRIIIDQERESATEGVRRAVTVVYPVVAQALAARSAAQGKVSDLLEALRQGAAAARARAEVYRRFQLGRGGDVEVSPLSTHREQDGAFAFRVRDLATGEIHLVNFTYAPGSDESALEGLHEAALQATAGDRADKGLRLRSAGGLLEIANARRAAFEDAAFFVSQRVIARNVARERRFVAGWLALGAASLSFLGFAAASVDRLPPGVLHVMLTVGTIATALAIIVALTRSMLRSAGANAVVSFFGHMAHEPMARAVVMGGASVIALVDCTYNVAGDQAGPLKFPNSVTAQPFTGSFTPEPPLSEKTPDFDTVGVEAKWGTSPDGLPGYAVTYEGDKGSFVVKSYYVSDTGGGSAWKAHNDDTEKKVVLRVEVTDEDGKPLSELPDLGWTWKGDGLEGRSNFAGNQASIEIKGLVSGKAAVVTLPTPKALKLTSNENVAEGNLHVLGLPKGSKVTVWVSGVFSEPTAAAAGVALPEAQAMEKAGSFDKIKAIKVEGASLGSVVEQDPASKDFSIFATGNGGEVGLQALVNGIPADVDFNITSPEADPVVMVQALVPGPGGVGYQQVGVVRVRGIQKAGQIYHVTADFSKIDPAKLAQVVLLKIIAPDGSVLQGPVEGPVAAAGAASLKSKASLNAGRYDMIPTTKISAASTANTVEQQADGRYLVKPNMTGAAAGQPGILADVKANDVPVMMNLNITPSEANAAVSVEILQADYQQLAVVLVTDLVQAGQTYHAAIDLSSLTPEARGKIAHLKFLGPNGTVFQGPITGSVSSGTGGAAMEAKAALGAGPVDQIPATKISAASTVNTIEEQAGGRYLLKPNVAGAAGQSGLMADVTAANVPATFSFNVTSSEANAAVSVEILQQDYQQLAAVSVTGVAQAGQIYRVTIDLSSLTADARSKIAHIKILAPNGSVLHGPATGPLSTTGGGAILPGVMATPGAGAFDQVRSSKVSPASTGNTVTKQSNVRYTLTATGSPGDTGILADVRAADVPVTLSFNVTSPVANAPVSVEILQDDYQQLAVIPVTGVTTANQAFHATVDLSGLTSQARSQIGHIKVLAPAGSVIQGPADGPTSAGGANLPGVAATSGAGGFDRIPSSKVGPASTANTVEQQADGSYYLEPTGGSGQSGLLADVRAADVPATISFNVTTNVNDAEVFVEILQGDYQQLAVIPVTGIGQAGTYHATVDLSGLTPQARGKIAHIKVLAPTGSRVQGPVVGPTSTSGSGTPSTPQQPQNPPQTTPPAQPGMPQLPLTGPPATVQSAPNSAAASGFGNQVGLSDPLTISKINGNFNSTTLAFNNPTGGTVMSFISIPFSPTEMYNRAQAGIAYDMILSSPDLIPSMELRVRGVQNSGSTVAMSQVTLSNVSGNNDRELVRVNPKTSGIYNVSPGGVPNISQGYIVIGIPVPAGGVVRLTIEGLSDAAFLNNVPVQIYQASVGTVQNLWRMSGLAAFFFLSAATYFGFFNPADFAGWAGAGKFSAYFAAATLGAKVAFIPVALRLHELSHQLMEVSFALGHNLRALWSFKPQDKEAYDKALRESIPEELRSTPDFGQGFAIGAAMDELERRGQWKALWSPVTVQIGDAKGWKAWLRMMNPVDFSNDAVVLHVKAQEEHALSRWASVVGTLAGGLLPLVLASHYLQAVSPALPWLPVIGFAAAALATLPTVASDVLPSLRALLPSPDDRPQIPKAGPLLNKLGDRMSREVRESITMAENIVEWRQDSFLSRLFRLRAPEERSFKGGPQKENFLVQLLTRQNFKLLSEDQITKGGVDQLFFKKADGGLLEDIVVSLLTRRQEALRLESRRAVKAIDRAIEALTPKDEQQKLSFLKSLGLSKNAMFKDYVTEIGQMRADAVHIHDADRAVVGLKGLRKDHVSAGSLHWIAANAEDDKPVLVLTDDQGVTDALNDLLASNDSPALISLKNAIASRKVILTDLEALKAKAEKAGVVIEKDGQLLMAEIFKLVGGVWEVLPKASDRKIGIRFSGLDMKAFNFEGLPKDVLVERIMLTIDGLPLKVLSDGIKEQEHLEELKKYIAQFA